MHIRNLATFILIIMASSLHAAETLVEVVTVLGSSNIFSAGESEVESGTIPPSISLPPGMGRKLVVATAVGATAGDSVIANLVGPDGGTRFAGVVGTDVNSTDKIAGLTHSDKNMFLTGVFVGDAANAVVPDRLAFSSRSELPVLSPEIRQTFFIGDGRATKKNRVQIINIPDDASRLFLGFVDAFDRGTKQAFRGDPGAYHDNIGAIVVELRISLE